MEPDVCAMMIWFDNKTALLYRHWITFSTILYENYQNFCLGNEKCVESLS